MIFYYESNANIHYLYYPSDTFGVLASLVTLSGKALALGRSYTVLTHLIHLPSLLRQPQPNHGLVD